MDDCKKNSEKFKNTAKTLKKYCVEPIYYRRSAGKKGYHFISYNNDLSFEELMFVRKEANDDELRMKYDNYRHENHEKTQFLFSEKRRKKATKWKQLNTS